MKYKSAVKEAAASADLIFNDDLYEKLYRKDNAAFWKDWRKRFCSRNLKPTNILNGCSGDGNIRQEFTRYFKSVLTPNSAQGDNKYKLKVDDFVNSPCDQSAPKVDITVMQVCVHERKNDRAARYDGICNEHVKYGGAQLLVHLCLLFNAVTVHSFVPADFFALA